MDPQCDAYPSLTDSDMVFFRRVVPTPTATASVDGAGEAGASAAQQASPSSLDDGRLGRKEGVTARVEPSALPGELSYTCLNEVKRLAQLLGNSVDLRRTEVFEARLDSERASATSSTDLQRLAEVDRDVFRQLRVISDHAEDTQMMKAPWGCGDRIRFDEMPASLRYLVHHTQHAFPGIGRLRHVQVWYSPTGTFYREPRCPKYYDGHDYVLIPLRADEQPTVVTFSPQLRSRVSRLAEILAQSWTTRDVDALLPSGSMTRVYGEMRYDWGWGIRPGRPWFGSTRHPIPHGGRPLQDGHHWWLPGPLSRWSGMKRMSCSSVGTDAAIIALHFEGPRPNKKKRSLLLHPEGLIFGVPPAPEDYSTWTEDRPTAEAVREEGVIRFLLRNYTSMVSMW